MQFPIDRFLPDFSDPGQGLMPLSSDELGKSDIAQILASSINEINQGVLIADARDAECRLVYVNRAFEAITGYQSNEAIGKNCRFLQGNDRLQPEILKLREAIANQTRVAVTLRNYRKDSGLFWNALRLIPVVNESGLTTHFVGLMSDVTQAHLTAEQLDRAEHLDQLTGIVNRYAFLERLDGLLASRALARTLVVKMDVARFHEINTAYGFDVGDALLQQMARRLEGLDADVIGRTGANEFALARLLEQHENPGIWLRKISQALTRAYVLPGTVIDVKLATGYVVGDIQTKAITLIRQAATALRQSKTNPMREVQEFNHQDERNARRRLRLTSELQNAVANAEFLLHYQPKIDLRTGAVIGAEALLRWDHSVFGVQGPSTFVRLAEETGLILDIGHWTRRQVASFASEINRQRTKPLRFSVNVSTIEVTHRDLVASVSQILQESAADPSWLTLELTESILAEPTPELLEIFARLRKLGVGLAIDDFGTGYSSLRHLEAFPLSEIKIDKHFVRNLAESPAKRILVKAVVDLGRESGIDIVAEGIETESERDILRSMECPFAQGFLFSRPVCAAAFKELCRLR
ncbi:MAG: putative bifunctional diguanylate cyclase/phosphodiesterase [Hyphomicrobiaceae bacterium]